MTGASNSQKAATPTLKQIESAFWRHHGVPTTGRLCPKADECARCETIREVRAIFRKTYRRIK